MLIFLLDAILHLIQSIGIGPHDTLITSDGWYYEKKATLLHNWAVKMNCEEEEQVHLCTQVLHRLEFQLKGNPQLFFVLKVSEPYNTC